VFLKLEQPYADISFSPPIRVGDLEAWLDAFLIVSPDGLERSSVH